MKTCHHANGKRKHRRMSSTVTPPKPFATLPETSREAVAGQVQGLFSPFFIRRILAGATSGLRERLLSIEVVMISMLNFVVCELESFLQVVDKLRSGDIPGLQAVEASPQAFYKRLRAIPHTVFLDLLGQTTGALGASQNYMRQWVKDLAPFAAAVYALDDTTLDALMRRSDFLKQYSKGAMETLGGRLGCALDLVTGKFAEILYDADSAANEKTHARPLVERLGRGALYVFDLGFFAFPFLDFLTERGCYFISRLRSKTSFEVIIELAERSKYRDRIIWLGKYRADRAAHPVRLVELQINGEWWSYITNVLDPQQLSASALWALYGQRWKIEMAFAAVKRALGMAFLRVTHQNGILIQIWSTLTVYQVLQDLRLEIACASGWRDDDVSWYNLMQRISWYAERERGKSLRSWLVSEAPRLSLQKRGTRKRRIEELPSDILAECLPPPQPPDFGQIHSRPPRQGDRKAPKRRSPLIVAGLSLKRYHRGPHPTDESVSM
jgi:hypothetical protein